MSFFGGSGGQSNITNSSSTSSYWPNFYGPYLQAATTGLNNIEKLRDQKFQGYDVSNFGPMSNGTQQQAWDQTKGLQGAWDPYFDSANSTLNSYGGFAQGAFNRASQTPTALEAAQPYTAGAAQTWPGASSQYLNPYINDTVNSANQLSSKNFTDNILPKLQASYASSGGGLGSKDYGRDMNWALTNFNDSTNRTTQAALADAYNKSAGIFQNDANRLGALSGTVGNQATAGMGALTALGTGAAGAGTQQANAYGNLGTQDLTNNLSATNALLQTGNQQQEIENWKNKYNADQFQQSVQWPYQTNAWAADNINKYQWPHGGTTVNNSSQQSYSNSAQNNSPASSILGGLSAVGSLLTPGEGGSSALGNIWSNLGSMGSSGSLGGASALAAMAKRGGHFSRIVDRKPKAFAHGGYLGMDEASYPSFAPNPGYFKWMDSTAFADGGTVEDLRGRGALTDADIRRLAENDRATWLRLRGEGRVSEADYGRAVQRYDDGGKVGGMLGSILGSIGGSFFGGPIGGMAGNTVGGMLGGLLPFAAGGHAATVKSTRLGNDKMMAVANRRRAMPEGVTRPLAIPNASSGFFSRA